MKKAFTLAGILMVLAIVSIIIVFTNPIKKVSEKNTKLMTYNTYLNIKECGLQTAETIEKIKEYTRYQEPEVVTQPDNKGTCVIEIPDNVYIPQSIQTYILSLYDTSLGTCEIKKGSKIYRKVFLSYLQDRATYSTFNDTGDKFDWTNLYFNNSISNPPSKPNFVMANGQDLYISGTNPKDENDDIIVAMSLYETTTDKCNPLNPTNDTCGFFRIFSDGKVIPIGNLADDNKRLAFQIEIYNTDRTTSKSIYVPIDGYTNLTFHKGACLLASERRYLGQVFDGNDNSGDYCTEAQRNELATKCQNKICLLRPAKITTG